MARERLARDPGSRKLFFRKDRPLAEGERFRNPELADLLDSDGALKTLPFRDNLEAFYAATLEKVAGT